MDKATEPVLMPVDTGVLEDWMFGVIETAESMSFWLDMKDRVVADRLPENVERAAPAQPGHARPATTRPQTIRLTTDLSLAGLQVSPRKGETAPQTGRMAKSETLIFAPRLRDLGG
jgi:hypothetical protein